MNIWQMRPKQGAPRLIRQHVARAKQEAHGAKGLSPPMRVTTAFAGSR